MRSSLGIRHDISFFLPIAYVVVRSFHRCLSVHSRGGGVPQGTYPPPPEDRTAYGVLDMLRSVCLLRSRKRTFLSLKLFLPFS